jgi:hypothetical protein
MIDLNPLSLLYLLMVAHFICDYPLQGDFLAKAKNLTAPIQGVPWWQAMGAHSFIHGGAVALITGNIWLGLLETILHFGVDTAKCRGHLTFNQDQALHLVCKVVIVILWSVTQ